MREGPAGGNAVEKTLAVLGALGDHERITDIVAATGLPKSTVHRILQTLVATGFARVDGGGGYGGGPNILRLAGRLLSRIDLAQSAQLPLDALRQRTGSTVHLALLNGDEAVYVAKLEGLKPYRMASRVGMALPLHCTAIGKAILAQLPTEAVRSLVGRTGLPARTARTLTELDDLLEHLERVRQDGWAFDDEENERGVRCAGAAVHDHTGAVVGALSVSHLVVDDGAPAVSELGRAVVAAASEVSATLGAAGGRPA